MPEPRLSVYLIVKNEADCLLDCLESVASVADEILVADTGSTDNTARIAEAFGARVIRIPWTDDFAAARNSAIALLQGAWILHMDADEVLDAESAATIRRIVDDSDYPADAVEVVLANYSNDPRAWRWVAAPAGSAYRRGYAGYLPVPLLRLFRNRLGYAYREAVHENITASVRELGGRIATEDLLIHHYGYEPDAEKRARKADTYLALARGKCASEPGSAKAWSDRAEQALACGEAQEAEAAARRALELDCGHLGAGTTLANLLLNRGDLDEARAVLERFRSEEGLIPHVETALGAIDYHQGRTDAALARLRQVVLRAPHAVLARGYLARVYDIQGDARHAERELALAVDLAPGLAEFEGRLRALRLRVEGEAAFQAGLLNEALEMLVEALRLDADDPITQNDIGVVLAALGEAEKARESFVRALKLAPGFADAEANLRAIGQA
ncbi:MAG: glycosyltransferase [Candidatus Hydrogenedentes bacterium]|nr:glycosyltransferase [Candidatus Hydrogenedentota bacterium]